MIEFIAGLLTGWVIVAAAVCAAVYVLQREAMEPPTDGGAAA